MELIDWGERKSKASELLNTLTYIAVAVLAVNFIVLVGRWLYDERETDILYFILPTVIGIFVGLAISVFRSSIKREVYEVKNFWKNLFESHVNGIIITDLFGKIKYVNDYVIKFHGYSLNDLENRHISEIVLSDCVDAVRKCVSDLVSGGSGGDVEVKFLTKNGELKFAELSGRLIKYKTTDLILFVEVDISDKKKFENDLIEAEQRYRELFENAVVGVYRSTPEGKLLDVNPALVKMFGAKSKEEILNKNASEFYPNPKDRENFVRSIEVSGIVSSFESKMKRIDGSEIFVREHARAVRDLSGNILYYEGMIEDITAQKIWEKRLKESEYMYRTLVENSLVGTYIFQDGRFKFVSGQLAHIFGFSIDEILNTREILDFVHPADREKVISMFASNLRGETPSAGFSFRIIKKNGEIAVVEVLNNLIDYEDKPALLGTMLDITDKAKSQQRERILSNLLLRLNDAVVITDEKANILEVNDAFCKITGYSKEEVVGKRVSILKSGLHDLDFYQKMWESILSEGYWSGEIVNRKKNGELYSAFLSISSLKDENYGVTYYLGIQSDITERKKVEEQIKYQASLLENVNDAIIAADLNFRITSWNKAAERMYGYKAEEVLGKEISEVIPVEFQDVSRDEVRKIIFEKGSWSGEAIHYNRWGKKIYVSSSITVLRDSTGNPIGTVGINRDITEQKVAEEKLRLYAEQLETMNAQLQELNKLKNEFLANTSHELRTPLNSIIGFLSLIKDGLYENHEEMIKFVDNALTSARHLLNIINDILDIAKIEAGKLELDIDNIEISSLLSEVWTLSHVQAKQKNLEYRIVHPDKKVYVRGDRNRLKQILLNLIGNAIKFTHKGGITVKVEVLEDKGYCKFIVSDTGIGISKEKQSKLFQKFVQVDGTTTRKYGGTGLGLAITKSLVEMMGGTIELYSEGEGKGTTVMFTVPLATVSDSSEQIEIEQGKIYGEIGPLVMSIDDDSKFAYFLKNLIVRNSFRFIWFNNSDDGWRYILRFKPDILILDYAILSRGQSRIKDGLEIFFRLQNSFSLKDLPVVILTGYPQKVREILNLSFVNYNPNVFEKPIEPSALLNLLTQYVKGKKELRILLADDDPEIESYLRKILPKEYQLDYAKNGREAIDMIKSNSYDILLLDLVMPEMNGYEVIKVLRLDRIAPELPILVLTNYPEPSTEEEKELLSRSMGVIVIEKRELNSNPDYLVNLIIRQVKTK